MRVDRGAGRHHRLGLTVAAPLLAGLTACGWFGGGEDYAGRINELCAETNKRLATDLAIRGNDDIYTLRERMAERIEAVESLHQQVSGLEPPKASDEPIGWLARVTTFIAEMRTLESDIQEHTQPGEAIVIALQGDIHDDAAEAAGRDAASYELDDCADISSWRFFDPENGDI
jgi:hypothetical protein